MFALEGPGRGVYSCEYVPKHPGLHTLNIFYNRVAIHGSPFPLRAVDRSELNRFQIFWFKQLCSNHGNCGIENKKDENLHFKVLKDVHLACMFLSDSIKCGPHCI